MLNEMAEKIIQLHRCRGYLAFSHHREMGKDQINTDLLVRWAVHVNM